MKQKQKYNMTNKITIGIYAVGNFKGMYLGENYSSTFLKWQSWQQLIFKCWSFSSPIFRLSKPNNLPNARQYPCANGSFPFPSFCTYVLHVHTTYMPILKRMTMLLLFILPKSIPFKGIVSRDFEWLQMILVIDYVFLMFRLRFIIF